jgi:hypothetical protein
MNNLKMWCARSFNVITNDQAKEWGLTPHRNIYGDEINHLNCRSMWKDSKGRDYRVELLFNN